MKIGSMEGTPEEVNNFFQNNGLNISDYLDRPTTPLANRWLVIPSISFVICIGILTLFSGISNNVRNFIFLLGFAFSLWAGVCVHIRFKSTWSAAAVILAGLLIMLVALGVLAPLELLEYYKNSGSGA